MKTTGTGIWICGLMLVAQTVYGQSVPERTETSVKIAEPATASPEKQPTASLVLPDLNPLYLASAQSIAACNDQDVIVVIGARWCSPCQTMKNYVFPQVAQRGGLDRLQFAYVDFDDQNEIATELMLGTAVPQVVYMQRKTGQWKTLAVIPKMVEADTVMDFIQWAQSPPAAEPESGSTAILKSPAGG